MQKIITSLFIMILAISLQAQNKKDGLERKIEAKKIAFLTDMLDLSPEEAQKFWPVYNIYNSELKSKRHNMDDDSSTLSAEEKLEQLISSHKLKVEIMENYTSKFVDIIGAEKTLILFEAEKGFKREMLKGMKRRKEKAMKRKSKEGK